MRLLCRLGIHRPVYTPTVQPAGATWTPPIRRCHHCNQLLPKHHT